MNNGNNILVIGATGQQGGAVARELLAKGYKIKALTRKPESEKAMELAELGAEIVKGDLDDPASLENAMMDTWGVFAVQNSWEGGVEKEEEQGKRTAEIAKKMGVKHLVYTSVGSADKNTGIPHFDNKFRVEETIRNLDLPSYTILRPVFFMDNWNSQWFKPGIDDGNVAIGIKPDTKLQMIAVEDIGKYGLWAFQNQDKLNGHAIDIAGDNLTMPETAKIIGSAAGREIGFSQVPIEDARKFSEDFALMLEWFDGVGYNADIQTTSKESGIKPTRFADWAGKIKW